LLRLNESVSGITVALIARSGQRTRRSLGLTANPLDAPGVVLVYCKVGCVELAPRRTPAEPGEVLHTRIESGEIKDSAANFGGTAEGNSQNCFCSYLLAGHYPRRSRPSSPTTGLGCKPTVGCVSKRLYICLAEKMRPTAPLARAACLIHIAPTTCFHVIEAAAERRQLYKPHPWIGRAGEVEEIGIHERVLS